MPPTQRPSGPKEPSEGAQSPVPRLNWDVLIRCKDCGEVRRVVKPDKGVEVIERESGPPLRMVLIWVPNACPECKNIRAVDDDGEAHD
jgi:hypothetical protein